MGIEEGNGEGCGVGRFVLTTAAAIGLADGRDVGLLEAGVSVGRSVG